SLSLSLFQKVICGPCKGFPESAVASRRLFQFNPAAHDLLAKHDSERMATALQTAAGDGGPLRAGGHVLVERQPPNELQRTRLGNPGTARRQVLSEPPQRVRSAAAGLDVAPGIFA